MFRVASFIRNQNIDFIERGPNVKRGHINIKCPLCGDDPSHHMGINEDTGQWGCWRNPLHRGSRPHRLLKALLGLSWPQVEALVVSGGGTTTQSLDELAERLSQLVTPQPESSLQAFEMPTEFKPVKDAGLGGDFLDYLEGRGFTRDEARELSFYYDLRYCLVGEFKGRLILPVKYEGRLVGWTGRALADSSIRYKSFPVGDQIKRVVFNYDAAAEGGLALKIDEGPFDALKIDFFGKPYGLRAVALFGVSATQRQISIVSSLSLRFDSTSVLLDSAAEGPSMFLQKQLSFAGVGRDTLPVGVKDPGDLTREQVLKTYLKEILRNRAPQG